MPEEMASVFLLEFKCFTVLFLNLFPGEKTSIKQKRDESPPPEANGHIPLDSNSQVKTANSNEISESPSDNIESGSVEENLNNSVNGSTMREEKATTPENKEVLAQEQQVNGEESLGEEAAASQGTTLDHSASHGNISGGESELPVVVDSISSVGGEGVAMVTSGIEKKPELTEAKDVVGAQDGSDGGTDSVQHRVDSQTSLSGEQSTVPNKETSLPKQEETATHRDSSEVSLSGRRSASKASLSGQKDTASHSNTNAVPTSQRDTSQVSLSSAKDTTPVQDQTNRKGSMTVREYFGTASDDDIHLSRQSLGSSHQQHILSSTAEVTQPSESREIAKGDSPSLGVKEVPADEKINVSEGVHPAPAKDDSLVNDESAQGRICTVTATVRIGSLENPLGQKTVTLTGSVYRVPKEEGDPTTPNPGDRIGVVKGDVTSTPVDNEASEKLATLRGDLFAVSDEALANGHIATASIDVLSCGSGEKVATITADVAPSDDVEHQSGVISGEVLAMSDGGSYDDKIGSLSGKVVALTFDEDIISIGSWDD